MAKKFYTPETIDDLMESVSYEEVLRHYEYPVKGMGKNRGSNCPRCGKDFRHFKINTHRNTAHCFPCGWSGNPIQFIQEVEKVGFIEAVEKYAQIGDYRLPVEKREYTVQERILYHTVQFYKQFRSEYLIKRGISEKVIQDYQIGYAPGGIELKTHLNNLSFSDEDLLAAGVIVERNGQYKDFFYQCVIVPVLNGGVVVDIYGRHTQDSKVKHMYLYGDHIAFNLDKLQAGPVIIVESIINALTLLSHGVQNVFASGGTTRFTKRHARQLIAKNPQSIYIGFDTGDLSKAGQKGAIEAGKLLEDAGLPTKIIQMPVAIDINELFVQNEDAFAQMRQLIEAAVSVKEYELKFLLSDMPVEWIESYLASRKEA